MRQNRGTVRLLVAGSVAAVSLGSALGLATAPAAVAVVQTATTTTLASSPNPSTSGQVVTLTATVSAADSSSPTGTVSFLDAGTEIGTGTIASGTATLATSGLGVGTHSLTATYLGDKTTYEESVSAAVDQVVAAPPPPPAPPVTTTPPAPPKPVKKPVVHLSVSTAKASVGDKVTLKWRSKRADAVKASGDWNGQQKAKGSASIRLTDRGKHVFRLTVQNASGADRAKVTVLASRKAKELELTTTDELVLGGTKVEVDADGLAKREVFTIRLAGKPLLKGKADKRGDVHQSVQLAKDAPEGELALTITGSNPDRVGTATLHVIKPVKALQVKVKKDEIARKKAQMVTVTGLAPGEEVTIRYAGEVIATRKAPESGKLSYAFKVGDDSGDKTVTVTGQAPGRTGEATFEVLDGDADGGGGGETQL